MTHSSLRIALVVPGFSRHAADWAIPALQKLACALAQRHDVHVFSLRYPPPGTTRFCGLTHHALGSGNRAGLFSLRAMIRAIRAILKQHRRTPFDLLHAFWLDEPAYAAGFAGLFLRIPVLASMGGGELIFLPEIKYGTQGSWFRRFIVERAIHFAGLVSVGSYFAGELCLAHGIDESRLVLAPLGVDVELFRPQTVEPHAPSIIQAASLTAVKDQAQLLNVFALIRQALPDARLSIAGDGPLAGDLRRQAAELSLGKAVDFRGAIPFERMPEFYRGADLYLQTSRFESQGMSVLEAMACGVPATGTPVGVIPQVSLAWPSWEPGEIAAAAIEYLSQRDDRARRDENRAFVEEHFSISASVNHFQAIYDELLLRARH